MFRLILKITGALFLILVIASFFTNPSKADFQALVESRLKAEFADKLENPAFSLIAEEGTKFAAQLAEKMVVRDNYFVCSIYTVEMPTGDYKYIGAFKMFYPLQENDPISDLKH